MALDLQYDIVNYSPATASPVEANFNRTENFINTELVHRDGTVAMTGPLRLFGNPVQDLDAASKAYVDSVIPIGLIMMFGGTAVPPGGRWALCNGAEVETVTYQTLFSVIGNNFTPTPVAGRFNLPNLQGRIAVGPTTEAPAIAIGNTGGNRESQLARHSHQMDHGHAAATTSTETGWHQHTETDHLHYININSGGQNESHYHGPYEGTNGVLHDGGAGALGIGAPTFAASTQPTTGWASNDHQHNVQGYSGAADRAMITGNQSAFHTHTVAAPTHTGRTAEEGVTSPSNTNLPPFLCVQYLIRVS